MTITRQALAVNTENTLQEITEHILFDFFNEYPITSHISVTVVVNDVIFLSRTVNGKNQNAAVTVLLEELLLW